MTTYEENNRHTNEHLRAAQAFERTANMHRIIGSVEIAEQAEAEAAEEHAEARRYAVLALGAR